MADSSLSWPILPSIVRSVESGPPTSLEPLQWSGSMDEQTGDTPECMCMFMCVGTHVYLSPCLNVRVCVQSVHVYASVYVCA